VCLSLSSTWPQRSTPAALTGDRPHAPLERHSEMLCRVLNADTAKEKKKKKKKTFKSLLCEPDCLAHSTYGADVLVHATDAIPYACPCRLTAPLCAINSPPSVERRNQIDNSTTQYGNGEVALRK
jgi:hypothetical protein